MIKPLVILTIVLSLFSCDRPQKKLDTKIIDRPKQISISKQIDILEPDHDTLPNGIRLLENIDSAMVNYYKEVVGSDTLKGGYITCYGIDDSIKYFYLRHGNKLHLLNQTPIYTSTWSLGTLEKDFDKFFMTQIDNGNGRPFSYQIFEKQTGKNILGDNVEANSYAFLQDTLFMLYNSWNEHKRTKHIILFNVRTKTKEVYKLPVNLPEFCDIQIAKLSRKNLKLSFETYVGDNFESIKTYSR